MHSLFTPVDTLDGSNLLRAVHSADGTLTVENFLMPVTSFQNNGQPASVEGCGKTYGLYLEVEAVLVGSTFETLTSQLWLDPHNNDGTPTVSDTNNPAFASTQGDSLLATGTMVSATLGTAPNGIRTADFVKSMTPTPAGNIPRRLNSEWNAVGGEAHHRHYQFCNLPDLQQRTGRHLGQYRDRGSVGDFSPGWRDHLAAERSVVSASRPRSQVYPQLREPQLRD